MSEIKLEIEELEAKIAPSILVFADGPAGAVGPAS